MLRNLHKLIFYWLTPYVVCSLIFLNNAHAKDTHNKKDPQHAVKKVDTTPNSNDQNIWSMELTSSLYRSQVLFNIVTDFSADSGWDVQLASYNIPTQLDANDNSAWDSYVNVSKSISLPANFQLVMGSQNDTPLFADHRQWHNFNYSLVVFQPNSSINLHIGPYWANKALATTTDTVGYTLGFSLEFINHNLCVQGDYISGHASMSGATLNWLYRVHTQAKLILGLGIPETNTGNEFFGTLGFSLSSVATD